jgi:hypothetical protein
VHYIHIPLETIRGMRKIRKNVKENEKKERP